jgi:hypothetical protein
VGYACKEGEVWISQASLLWSEDDLLNFFQEVQDDSSMRICQIALLMPSGSNEIETWRMVTLKEIWTGRIRDHHQRAMVYVGIDGERLLKFLAAYDESQIELIEMAYPLVSSVPSTPARLKTARKRRHGHDTI